MAAGTKTKKTKVDTLYPPREIRENTKARRSWLSEKLAEVNARPGFEGKIVGNGSYQSVSLYSVTEVSGRLRHRGHCQFCGNHQVVDDNVLVLHGYSRPGIGYVFNECPGVRKQPLQQAQSFTEVCLIDAQSLLALLTRKLEAAESEYRAASTARFSGDGVEQGAYSLRPRGLGRKPTPEQVAAYEAAYAEWTQRFPITARYDKADARKAELTEAVWRAKQQVEHFARLIGLKLLGQSLIEEVVA